MRFTRPGARPFHARGRSDLDATQLRGFVLCARIDDKSACSELRPRQVLELVAGSVWWIELHMEVMVAAGTTGWCLVHCHHVWQRTVEEAVVLLQHTFQDPRERFIVVIVEVEQSGAMPNRRQVDLVGPARERRYERNPVLVPKDGPLAAALSADHVAVKAAAGLAFVPGLGPQLPLQDRWDERIRVDLSVWMAQRDADLLAAVLEHRDVVIGLGDLGFEMPWSGGAQRAMVWWRVIRAVLTPGGDGNPLF